MKNKIKVTSWSEGGKGLSGYKIFNHDKLIYETEVGESTNNIACFLGICHAIYQFPNDIIYTNNNTALTWCRQRRCNTDSELLFHRVDRAERFLRTLEQIKVSKC